MNDWLSKLHEARDFLTSWCSEAPALVLTTGSGFAWLGNELEDARKLPYEELPHFPTCTNPQHPGVLMVGRLWGHRIAVQLGRIHCYEGYSAAEVAFPVRALALWGIKTFILTNAAGAINPGYHEGEFMAFTDHINLIGQNPLTGPNLNTLGSRFPDLSSLYDQTLRKALVTSVQAAGLKLHEGIYGAMPGPSYETPAEIRMLGNMGADAVGMSTVPEAIALGQMGRRVLALSCLTNAAAGRATEPITDEEITQVLDQREVQTNLRIILKGVLDAA